MPESPPWKILIVDDEPEVHEITRIVLGALEFDGRHLQLLEATSGQQAREMLGAQADIALMLVDVVMETEHAGLDLVKYVREELGNRFVRIVLRTGNPGQAPERQVIRAYDINDYKEKTELTSRKLETLIYTALRGYRDIMIIEAARRGLERVISASAQIHSRHKTHDFASAVLAQLAALVGLQRGALYCAIPEPSAHGPDELHVSAATGEFAPLVSLSVDKSLPRAIVASVHEAYAIKQHVFRPDHYVLHFTDSRDSESLLIVAEAARLTDLDLHLIRVFCTNVSIAFENLHLNQDLFESQMEMICVLAGAAETRSQETANHVKRVGMLAEFLAREMGMDEKQSEALRFAAPLHDLGKIAIPDHILNKPGAHTPEEAIIMRTHAERGAQLLDNTRVPLIRLAAEIARSHHENWDGTGYPNGLAGEQIAISGRITALADVYDALGSRRCYKDAWARDDILALIRAERGKKFDPRLVDILIAKWDVVESIRALLPD